MISLALAVPEWSPEKGRGENGHDRLTSDEDREELVRLRHYGYFLRPFTSEGAIYCLHLLFDVEFWHAPPNDPSTELEVIKTIKFTMSLPNAESYFENFLEARFIEPANTKNASGMDLLQLTAKGVHILRRFCDRTGVREGYSRRLLKANKPVVDPVSSKRRSDGEGFSTEQVTVEAVFREFLSRAPNLMRTTTNPDLHSRRPAYHDRDKTETEGTTSKQESSDKTIPGFTGTFVVSWLMNNRTTVNQREAFTFAYLFYIYDLMVPIGIDDISCAGEFSLGMYRLTQKGQCLVGHKPSQTYSPRGEGTVLQESSNFLNWNMESIAVIIDNPVLRQNFGHYLEGILCRDSLRFSLEVQHFLDSHHSTAQSQNHLQRGKQIQKLIHNANSRFATNSSSKLLLIFERNFPYFPCP